MNLQLKNWHNGFLLFSAGLLIAVSGTVLAESRISAKAIASHMDKEKYTSSEIKSYLKDLKGKNVEAAGKVHNIMTGRRGTRVVIHVDTPKSRDFVVDVYVDNAPELHKDDQVFCHGDYVKYNPFTVNGITLKNGKCSKR